MDPCTQDEEEWSLGMSELLPDLGRKRRICWHEVSEDVLQTAFPEESSRVREMGGEFMWCEWERRAGLPMHSSGMNSTPAMAPLSPGLSGSPPLTSVSVKNATSQSLGSLSAGIFSPSLTKGTFHQAIQASGPMNSPTSSIMSSPKLWQKASISRLAEEFFWIGGSVVAQPKWRLGQIGKIHLWLKAHLL